MFTYLLWTLSTMFTYLLWTLSTMFTYLLWTLSTMFTYLHGNLRQSFMADDKQGDLFYSAGQTRETVS